MKLPKNGKVIVIDNEPKEADPLLKVLAKNRIPYIYFSGDSEWLPRPGDEFDDIRIIFLDINLTQNQGTQSIAAQLISTLRRIVRPGIPYVAAIWSNNQDAHRSLIEDLFSNQAPDIAPISKLFLTKSDFFRYDFETGYQPDPDRVDLLADLESRINECFSAVNSARLFIAWENLVSESISETVVNISNIVDNNCYWDVNLKHIYYKLAHAQLGKAIVSRNDKEIQNAALITLTSAFIDRVEMKIAGIEDIVLTDLSSGAKNFYHSINGSIARLSWDNFTYYLHINGTQKAQNKNVQALRARNNESEYIIAESVKSRYGHIFPRLNSELLISKSPKLDFHPGNVYRKVVRGVKKRNLLQTYFPTIKEKLNGDYKQADLKGFNFVEVECTPICDYSQSKSLRFRFLPGILYKADTISKLDDNLDSIYREIPPFEFHGVVYRLVFDYRLFKTLNRGDKPGFSSKDFLFRLKSELLIDIQARISSHVNRPGIVVVS